MSQKAIIYLGLFLGSFIGGLIPTIWGGSLYSFAGIFLAGVGGIIGIVAGYKLTV